MSQPRTQPQPPQLTPEPLFLLHNSKALDFILFSKFNKNIFYTGNRDGHFDVYDLSIRRSIFNCNPNSNAILSIIEINLIKILVYCRDGSLFELLKQDTSSQWSYKCVYKSENYTFCKIDVSLERNLLFLPSKVTSKIDSLSLNSYELLSSMSPTRETNENFGMLMCVKVIGLDRLLAAYENGDVCLFNLTSKKQLDRKTLFYGQPILTFDYSLVYQIGFVGCNEITFKKFSIINNQNRIQIANDPIELKNAGINAIKIRSKDSKIFATAGWDSRIRVYGTKLSKLLCVLDFHKEAVNVLDFSMDNNILAAASNDGLISFWNLY